MKTIFFIFFIFLTQLSFSKMVRLDYFKLVELKKDLPKCAKKFKTLQESIFYTNAAIMIDNTIEIGLLPFDNDICEKLRNSIDPYKLLRAIKEKLLTTDLWNKKFNKNEKNAFKKLLEKNHYLVQSDVLLNAWINHVLENKYNSKPALIKYFSEVEKELLSTRFISRVGHGQLKEMTFMAKILKSYMDKEEYDKMDFSQRIKKVKTYISNLPEAMIKT